MDQAKIGRFIAARRKAQGLTQRQLADALSISDKRFRSGNAEKACRRFR